MPDPTDTITEGTPEPRSADQALQEIEERARANRQALVCQTAAGTDVLEYIAMHGGTATRRAVAANTGTSPTTDRLLSTDNDDEVRTELARKIARLLPDLSYDGVIDVRELAIETLEKLASDQVPRVRAILAEEIKHLDCVPKSIVDRLARDVEEAVAAPVLEYSPLLSDIDLLEIIASAKATYILAAVARRHFVSSDVSDAIAASLDITAVAALLANPNAAIREQTLERLVEAAESVAAWHEPLVLRVDLSVRLVRRLATFVGFNLLEQLCVRSCLDEKAEKILNARLHTRLLSNSESEPAEPLAVRQTSDAPWNDQQIAQQLESAAERGNRNVIACALAIRANVPPDIVARIIDSRSAKAITALVWLARLPMRLAFLIQCRIMKLRSDESMPARNGKDFPLSEEEMLLQLGLFGLTRRPQPVRTGQYHLFGRNHPDTDGTADAADGCAHQKSEYV